jgi:hypothetical protein
MRRSLGLCFALLLVSGCGDRNAIPAPAPGAPDEGVWAAFHINAPDLDGRQYFYDRAQMRRTGDFLVSRWKIFRARDNGTSLYVTQINCRENTFTERGTVLIDAGGHRRELPQSELWIDHPITPNSATAEFRQMYCH